MKWTYLKLRTTNSRILRAAYANFRWLLLIVAILVIFLREPLFFSESRLWAEEGTRYYAYAYHYAQSPSWYMGLSNVQRGYFALWPNVATTIAANLAPVEQAPLITTLMALLVQLLPLGLIIWSNAEFWASPLRKITGLLICFLVPFSGEIWLNTINSQFYLALAVILILMEPLENALRKKWVYRLLLGVAGLTGLVSSMLAPVYVVLAWRTKDRERMLQALILGLCGLIQLGLLASSSAGDKTVGLRLADGRFYLLIFSAWTQSIGLISSGTDGVGNLATWIIAEHEKGNPTLVLLWTSLLTSAIAVLGWLSIRLSVRERIIFLGSYCLVLTISYVGALTGNKMDLIVPGVGSRYFWVPNVILGFLLMANAFNRANSKLRVCLCAVMLMVVLVLGGRSYQTTLLASQEWPNWRTEVMLWWANPEHQIQIWPPGWKITLKK